MNHRFSRFDGGFACAVAAAARTSPSGSLNAPGEGADAGASGGGWGVARCNRAVSQLQTAERVLVTVSSRPLLLGPAGPSIVRASMRTQKCAAMTRWHRDLPSRTFHHDPTSNVR